MRILTIAIVAASGLLAAPLAFADDPKPVTPVATATTPDPLICHAIVHEGMVVHRSECHTQKEWDQIHFHDQQMIREMQQRGLMSAPN